MLKKFSVRELVFIAMIGALLFILDLSISTGIDAITGIPASGTLITTLFFVALATIGGLTIRKFGTYIGMGLIYAILATPNTVFGPPGVYKILLGLIVGIVADMIVFSSNYRKIGYYLGLTAGIIVSLPILLYFMNLLGLPGAKELSSVLWFIIGLSAVESLIGTWIGMNLYEKKISKMRIIKQIQT